MPQSLADWVAENKPSGEMTSYTPTMRERQTDALRNLLFTDDRAGQAKANRLMGELDFTPFALPAYAYDVGRSAAEGDPTSLAITAGVGAIPMVGRELRSGQNLRRFLSDEAGMFMGPKAKKADLSKLSQAQLLKEQGASRDEIHQATGWFQQADGKWRFEVSDAEAKMKGRAEGQLGTVMDHPELYENYPELAKIGVRAETLPPGVAGYYDPGKKQLGYTKYKSDPRDKKSFLLHELMHGVQDIEGFAPGTNKNPANALISGSYANQEYKTRLADYTRDIGQDEMAKILPNLSPASIAQVVAARRVRIKRKPMSEELQSLQRQAADAAYEKALGEVEARNVQTRQHMTAGQQRASPPWTTQDVQNPLVEQESGGLGGLFNKLGLSLSVPAKAEAPLDRFTRMRKADEDYFRTAFGEDADEAIKLTRRSSGSDRLQDLVDKHGVKDPNLEKRVYGIGMKDEDIPEFWQDLHKQTVNIIHADNPAELTDEAFWAMRDIPHNYDPAKPTWNGKIAVAKMEAAMNRAKELGMDQKQFFRNVFNRAGKTYGADAPEMMKHMLEKFGNLLK